MKSLIEPPAFLEALKYANPLPSKINLLPIITPPPAGTKKTGAIFWIILGGGLSVIGIYCLIKDHKNNKSNKHRS